jgi:arginine decarboxylase
VIVGEREGRLVSRFVPQQDQATITRLLGYQPQPAPWEPAAPRPVAARALRRRAYQRPQRSVQVALTGD